MKLITKLSLLTFVLSVMAATAFASTDAFMGTWKLNEAKSKIGAGGPKNETVTYEAAGDQIKVTLEGTQADGSTTKTEWTGKFDGKEYASSGNPNEDMRSCKQIGDRTLQVESKKGGKVVLSARVVVSADGKSRTVTVHGTDAKGKKYTSVAVYDKQ
jgi:phage tail sheath protein FI